VLANGNPPTTSTLLGDSGSGTVTPQVCQPSGASFTCAAQSGSNVLSVGGFQYSGTYNAATYTWTITGTGMIRNPNGAAVKKTITRVVTVSQNQNGPMATAWGRIYQDTSSTCLTIPDGTDVPGSLGTRGNLCLVGASVTGATSTVDVGGNVTLTPGNPFPKTNTGALDAGAGSGWTNPDYIYADDSSYATATVAGSGSSPNLLATGYGISIPSNSTLNGIQVKVFRYASAGNTLKDLTIQLLKAGVPVGNNKAVTAWWQTGAASNANYGANNDVWGTTWTGSDVDDPNFGVEIAAQNGTGTSARHRGHRRGRDHRHVHPTAGRRLDRRLGHAGGQGEHHRHVQLQRCGRALTVHLGGQRLGRDGHELADPRQAHGGLHLLVQPRGARAEASVRRLVRHGADLRRQHDVRRQRREAGVRAQRR